MLFFLLYQFLPFPSVSEQGDRQRPVWLKSLSETSKKMCALLGTNVCTAVCSDSQAYTATSALPFLPLCLLSLGLSHLNKALSCYDP